MFTNIVGYYVTLDMLKKAVQIKWIENAIEQSGDHFDDDLVKVVRS